MSTHWPPPARAARDANAIGGRAKSRGLSGARICHRSLLAGSALLFAVSTAVTVPWCASMAAMGGMPMAGGWTLSMAWMPMAGQTWPATAASFLGMWTVMMAAMMTPALVPMLWRYREALGTVASVATGGLTALAGLAYFCVWIACGTGVFVLGATLAVLELRLPALARAVPLAGGTVVLIAGVCQCTAWKARQLACCQQAPGRAHALAASAGVAWRHGLRLGLNCSCCCAGPTAILLVLGVMDLRMMALTTLAISAERLAPVGKRIARVTGGVAVAAGLLLIARAFGH